MYKILHITFMCIKSAELANFWLLYKLYVFEKADLLPQKKIICSNFYCKILIPWYQHLMLLSQAVSSVCCLVE